MAVMGARKSADKNKSVHFALILFLFLPYKLLYCVAGMRRGVSLN